MGLIVPGSDDWAKLTEQYTNILGVGPNQYQLEPFNDPSRIKLVMGGERSGKSLTGARYLVNNHLQSGSNALFWLIGRDYELCRPEFGYLVDFMLKLYGDDRLEISFPKEGPCAILLRDTGTRIETRTSEDPRRIAGRAPDGVLGCEVALWEHEAFLRTLGRLAEKRSWFWASGSFEGSLGWLPEVYKRWLVPNQDNARSFSLASWTNLTIFPGGRDNEEIRRQEALNSENRFMERFGGTPVPPTGRVFPEFETVTHVSMDAEYKPGKPVSLAIDPGYEPGVYSVLFIQQEGDNVRVFDEVYVKQLTHDEVIALCMGKACWKDVNDAAGDIATRQHQADRSAEEVWYARTGLRITSGYVFEEDGRERLHTFLRTNPVTHRPALLVNPRCRGLVAEMGCGPSPVMGGGIYRFKTMTDGTVIGEKPIDANNHSVKALCYWLVDRFGHVKRHAGRAANYLDV